MVKPRTIWVAYLLSPLRVPELLGEVPEGTNPLDVEFICPEGASDSQREYFEDQFRQGIYVSTLDSYLEDLIDARTQICDNDW